MAGRLPRLIAAIVDRATLVAPLFLLLIFAPIAMLVAYLASWFLVQATFLTINGQTVGKMIFSIRIVKVGTGRNG